MTDLTQIQNYPTLSNAANDPFGNFNISNILPDFAKSSNQIINTPTSMTGFFSGVSNTYNNLKNFFSFIGSGQGWTRIGLVIVGIIFLLVGLFLLGSRNTIITNVVSTAKEAVR